MNNKRNVAAIILAAGKGKRMQSNDKNKVTLQLGNKPLILHCVDVLEKMNFTTIVVVVGFAKESVREALKNSPVTFIEQTEQLGTAHAVQSGIAKVPSDMRDVLVIQGDDSHFYTEAIINQLLSAHKDSNAAVTMLTVTVENPFGLGRIVRNDEGTISAVVEEKDATDEQKEIQEVNPACYLFSIAFLKKYLPLVEKSSVTGEYYLTSLIDLAITHGETVNTVKGGKLKWRGVNTKEDLAVAEDLYKKLE